MVSLDVSRCLDTTNASYASQRYSISRDDTYARSLPFVESTALVRAITDTSYRVIVYTGTRGRFPIARHDVPPPDVSRKSLVHLRRFVWMFPEVPWDFPTNFPGFLWTFPEIHMNVYRDSFGRIQRFLRTFSEICTFPEILLDDSRNSLWAYLENDYWDWSEHLNRFLRMFL